MRKFFVAAALAVVAMFGATSSADAAFQIRVSTDGGATFGAAIDDEGAGDLDSGLVGSVRVSVAGISIRATAVGFISTDGSLLDLAIGGLAATNTSFNFVVQATIDGVNTAPSPQGLTTVFTGSALPAGGTYTTRTWVDDDNALFGTTGGGIVADTGNIVVNGPTFNGNFVGTDPYSVTTQIKATFTTGSNPTSLSLDSNNQITPAPAPAGLLLGLTGLSAMGLFRGLARRRKVVA